MTSSPIQTRFYFQFRLLIVLFFTLIGMSAAYAHKVASASLILYLETEEERTFKVSVQMEVESSGDAALDDEIGPEDAAKIFVETQLMVLIDEKEQTQDITTELINETDEDTPKELQRISVLLTWPGELPDDGKELALYLKETSEMSIVIATVKNGIPGRRLQVMFAGEYSRAENIEPIVEGNPFDKEGVKQEKKPESVEPAGEIQSPENKLIEAIIAGANASFYKTLLPLCLVFSFVILKGSFRALLFPFVLFLVVQSIGISLAATGIVPLLPWSIWVCVGALLLLSVDNLFSFKFRFWRYLAGVAGGFFLGNEIAQIGALLRLGGSPITPQTLVPFQVGFDGVVLIATLILGGIISLFAKYSCFRRIVVIPISIVLAGVAVFLLLQGNADIEKLVN